MPTQRLIRYLTALTLPLLAACGDSRPPQADAAAVLPPGTLAEIRYTRFGIPHVLADSYFGAGAGWGYAIAEDHLCTLSEAYLTFRGERSLAFGPEAPAAFDFSFRKPTNLESDLFWRFVATDAVIARYQDEQEPELREMIEGMVEGLNRYLDEIRQGQHAGRHTACREADWLQDVQIEDAYRRLYALNVAAAQAAFIPEIANAQPPLGLVPQRSSGAGAPSQEELDALAKDLRAAGPARFRLSGRHGLGSNTYALGAALTQQDHGLSFANPHWFWSGPNRFHQIHVKIPGRLNVAGAAILGAIPVLLGFNDDVAWSHTVSAAYRMALYELTLVPALPTRYLLDGIPRSMQAVTVRVPVRGDADIEWIERTLYRSVHGPIADLSTLNPLLGWNPLKAYAIRDINADNFRIFQNYLRWNQAPSLQAFIDVQKELLAVPWVNTAAAGRDDPRAYYADIGAVPNVSDAFARRCRALPIGPVFATAVPGLPLLDGARSSCELPSADDGVQAGAMGLSQMPSLERVDYVANMNDSYWLSNPAEPLTGFAAILGCEQCEQSWRGRLGHLQALDFVQQDPAPADSASLRALVLSGRVLTAESMRDPVVATFCSDDTLEVERDPLSGDVFDPPVMVNVAAACAALSQWNLRVTAEARGAHIWEEFWLRVETIPVDARYQTSFDPARPLTTPAELQLDAPALRDAFGSAVLAIQRSPFALDARRDEVLFAEREERIGLYGGCDYPGVFTMACSLGSIDAGYSMDAEEGAIGNSYLHVVTWGDSGAVEAFTMLAHSQSSDPASPHYGDATRAYADGAWLRLPFTEREIAQSRTRSVLLKR